MHFEIALSTASFQYFFQFGIIFGNWRRLPGGDKTGLSETVPLKEKLDSVPPYSSRLRIHSSLRRRIFRRLSQRKRSLTRINPRNGTWRQNTARAYETGLGAHLLSGTSIIRPQDQSTGTSTSGSLRLSGFRAAGIAALLRTLATPQGISLPPSR
jgi:hypothetical protein